MRGGCGGVSVEAEVEGESLILPMHEIRRTVRPSVGPSCEYSAYAMTAAIQRLRAAEVLMRIRTEYGGGGGEYSRKVVKKKKKTTRKRSRSGTNCCRMHHSR